MLRYAVTGFHTKPHQGFHPWNRTRESLDPFLCHRTPARLPRKQPRHVAIVARARCWEGGFRGFTPNPTKGFTLGTGQGIKSLDPFLFPSTPARLPRKQPRHVAIVARARCCEGGLRGFTQTPPRVSRLFQLFAALGRAGFCRAWGEYLATESRGGAMCRGATLPGSMGKAIRVRQ